MSEWEEYILEDVIDKFIDYRGKTPKKTDEGIPLVTAKVVKAGRILEPNEFIAEESYDAWMTRGLPEIDDVVLTTEAPLGEVALIKDKKVALAQRIITLRGNKTYVHNPFLKYYFQSATGQYELQSRASGTTVFGIKAAILKKMTVSLPSLPEQKAIASVLSSLDDKIDLLHRQNKTLEAMAETLFRQWFVEEAQEGWEEVRLSDLCSVITKGTTPTTLGHKFVDTGVNFVKAESITDEGNFLVVKFARISEETHAFLSRSILQSGDVLCSIAGTIGRIAIVDHAILPANTNQAIAILRVNSDKCIAEFVYLFLKSAAFREVMEGKIVHAVQPNLSLGEIGSTTLQRPSNEALNRFETVIQPIFEKKKHNTRNIHTLEKLRDTLLPKLMSGEVRVNV
jgi:type I restriction enzyme, S subunit